MFFKWKTKPVIITCNFSNYFMNKKKHLFIKIIIKILININTTTKLNIMKIQIFKIKKILEQNLLLINITYKKKEIN